jgi:hypothetical protein
MKHYSKFVTYFESRRFLSPINWHADRFCVVLYAVWIVSCFFGSPGFFVLLVQYLSRKWQDI